MATILESDDFDLMILTLLAKIKRLEREVKELAMLRRTVIGGGMSKSFADSSYLKLDGSKAMTGDLNMGDHDIDLGSTIAQRDLKFPDVVLRGQAGGTSNILKIVSRTGSDNRYLQSYGYFCRYLIGGVYDSVMRSYPLNGASWQLQTYTGGGYVLTAVLSDGDFRLPNLPVADPADGTSSLWVDVNNFVKLGT